MAGRRAVRHPQARAHLFVKDQMPQLLRLKNLVFVARPDHIEAMRVNSVAGRGPVASMKRPP